MTDDWVRFLRCQEFSIETPHVRVTIDDGRTQRVRVEESVEEYVLTSVVARQSTVESVDGLFEMVWARNRGGGITGFRIDGRGRLIGECYIPKIGISKEEFRKYVRDLAMECDHFEFVLTGKDIE